MKKISSIQDFIEEVSVLAAYNGIGLTGVEFDAETFDNYKESCKATCIIKLPMAKSEFKPMQSALGGCISILKQKDHS